MEYATALDIGKRKRRQNGINEDSVAVNLLEDAHRDAERRAGVFVLADGAGGAEAGDIASYVTTVEVTRHLTRRLWETRRIETVFERTDGPGLEPGARDGLSRKAVAEPLREYESGEVHELIEEAIGAAHTRLIEVINQLQLKDAYSTVVAGVKVDDRLHLGWVGDSRAYAVNTAPDRDPDGRVSLLTKDHSVVEQLVNRGEIDEVEAYVHRRGNRVTRALGGTLTEDPATSTIQVDTHTVRLFEEDVVLLTSDGLVDAYTGAPRLHEQYERAEDTESIEEAILEKAVTEEDIREVVLSAETLEDAAGDFVDLSNERGGKDNVSIVLFRDRSLDPSPEGGLPIRVYDPDPLDVAEWETVLMRPEAETAGSEPDASCSEPETVEGGSAAESEGDAE